jgi:hypothetical protein
MRQGVLDGPDQLRQACWEVLARKVGEKVPLKLAQLEAVDTKQSSQSPKLKRRRKNGMTAGLQKQRFGLPKGFVPRPQREQTNILLPHNVYRLPNGTEVVPCHPTGTLGRLHHIYALLTLEQFQRGGRGSTYVRTDGRIFDYSVDDVTSGREMFDTGLSVRDLERTGRYVKTENEQRNSAGKLKRATTR